MFLSVRPCPLQRQGDLGMLEFLLLIVYETMKLFRSGQSNPPGPAGPDSCARCVMTGEMILSSGFIGSLSQVCCCHGIAILY